MNKNWKGRQITYGKINTFKTVYKQLRRRNLIVCR